MKTGFEKVDALLQWWRGQEAVVLTPLTRPRHAANAEQHRARSPGARPRANREDQRTRDCDAHLLDRAGWVQARMARLLLV